MVALDKTTSTTLNPSMTSVPLTPDAAASITPDERWLILLSIFWNSPSNLGLLAYYFLLETSFCPPFTLRARPSYETLRWCVVHNRDGPKGTRGPASLDRTQQAWGVTDDRGERLSASSFLEKHVFFLNFRGSKNCKQTLAKESKSHRVSKVRSGMVPRKPNANFFEGYVLNTKGCT